MTATEAHAIRHGTVPQITVEEAADQTAKLAKAYYAARAKLARKTIKDEGAEVYGSAVKVRIGQFERILAGITSDGRFLNGCPQEWRWAIDRLHRMKSEWFDAQDAEARARRVAIDAEQLDRAA